MPFRGPIIRRSQPSTLPHKFACPQCGVFALQKWLGNIGGNAGIQRVALTDLRASVCPACSKYSLWIDGKLVHPKASDAPMPAEEMPDDLRTDYLEARLVFLDSSTWQ